MRSGRAVTHAVDAEADPVADDAPTGPPSQLLARLAISRAARASVLRSEERDLQSELARLRSKALQPNG